MKLIYKERQGPKVTKRYDKTQTPCQRLLASLHVSEEIKKILHKQYENLDSLSLLNNLECLQNQFWQHAWKAKSLFLAPQNLGEVNLSELNSSDLPLFFSQEVNPIRRYRRTPKPRKPSSPQTWRTRKDPFEIVWSKLVMNLQCNLHSTAKDLLLFLIEEDPHHFNLKQLRTLQRQIKKRRISQSFYEKSISLDGALSPLLSFSQEAAT